MKHSSVAMNTPCEFINITSINPLISKCQIKVCYVGDKPNRNRSVITKEVAERMAQTLPGSPIVGYYNHEIEDFEEHNKLITMNDRGEFEISESTRPYGFVGNKCWFQKYMDDGMVEHEYLMTEGYLWTGQYPEAQRIIDKGNNQSMELDSNSINATWSKDINGKPQFFIINEAVISKLCILGEDAEPCFEGATIEKVKFSLENTGFTNYMKKILDEEGGLEMEKENELVEEIVEEVATEEEVVVAEETETTEPAAEYSEEETEVVEETTEEEEIIEEEKSEDNNEQEEETENEYSLEDIPEYVELLGKYSVMEAEKASLETRIGELETELEGLKNFKLAAERKQKMAMIDETFYMLDEADKKNVRDNIDSYSLEDIEKELSVICVRNKLNLSEVESKETVEDPMTYSLDSNTIDANMPAWIQAVLEVADDMK